MSKTRKVRRARMAREKAEAARASAESQLEEVQELTADSAAKWDYIVEHLGGVLGKDTVLNAIIHGPASCRYTGRTMNVQMDSRQATYSVSTGLHDLNWAQIMQVHELIMDMQSDFIDHKFIIAHDKNKSCVMISEKAFHSLPEEYLAEHVSKDLLRHIRKAKKERQF